MLSVVVPVFNEAGNLLPLLEELTDALIGLPTPYEIILVDDGSTDDGPALMASLAGKNELIKVLTLKRNLGQTAALMAGIDHASGHVIVALDGDGQNDPADIPRLLDKLAEGYDVVSGWRRERHDEWRRVWLSRAANRLISRISGVSLHDYGCSLKAYRRDTIQSIRLYGEMHRFIPIYASWQGANVAEIPVNHRPRLEGKSNYGFNRILKVFLDLLVVQFLGRYETRPMYVFGGFGLMCWAIGLAAGAFSVYRKFFDDTSFILTPLPLLSAMSFMTGVLSILMGLLAELLVRTYYESQQKTPYAIKSKLNMDPEPGTERSD